MKSHSPVVALVTLLALPAMAAAEPRIEKDVRYADRSERNVLDIYVPEGVNSPPLVVWIHGGAFLVGDKAQPEGLQAFLDEGFAVASINYRFANQATWPAQLDDLRSAFTFLHDHADNYGYDGNRIASFGSSAGGHLSAIAGIALADVPKTRLVASVVWFPPIDFTTMDEDILRTGIRPTMIRHDDARSPGSLLIGAEVATHPELAREANPITYLERLPADTRLPDFLIMHGGKDPIVARGQSGRLFTALLNHPDVGNLEYILLPNSGHGDGNFQNPKTLRRVVEFLKTSFARSNE